MSADEDPAADADADAAGEPDAETAKTTPSRGAVVVRQVVEWCASNLRSILLLTLVVGAAAVSAGIYAAVYRPDRDIDHAAAQRVVQAASEGAVAALSYSSDSLDRDIAAAKLHLTGAFLEYYNTFTRDVVAPTVREKHLTQQTVVIRAAVSELHRDSAVVLAFVNENTTSPARKEPLATPSVVKLTMRNVDGAWLIAQLDPIG